MKSANPLICMVMLCCVSGIMSSSGSSSTFQSAAISNSQTQPGGKEVTIVVDHYRPPCVDRFAPQWRYFPLKLPLNPPFLNVDESSNIYLLGEVKITTINAMLKARLLRLLETAAPMDSIRGDFKHDQKRE